MWDLWYLFARCHGDWNLFGARQAVTHKDKMKISIATLPKFPLRETKSEEIPLANFFLPLPVFLLLVDTSQQTKGANEGSSARGVGSQEI